MTTTEAESELAALRRERLNHGIERMPFRAAASRLLEMALAEMDAGYREEHLESIDGVEVTLRRVFNVHAASIGWDDRFEIIVDDDQNPWDALIVLLSEVSQTYAVGGHDRHDCICLRRSPMAMVEAYRLLARR